MVVAGEASGNKQLTEVAGHVKSGAHVVDKAIVHAKDVHKIVKDTHKAIKKGDVKGVVKQVGKGIKKGKELKKFKKEVQGKYKAAKAPKAKKAKAEKTPKAPKATPGKKKRKPSKYNLFVAEKRKEGLTLKEISPLWKAEKAKQ
jgi:hypothetical protein